MTYTYFSQEAVMRVSEELKKQQSTHPDHTNIGALIRAATPQWQTIDTAPKDNTVILLCAKLDDEPDFITSGYWETYISWHGPLEDEPGWQWFCDHEPTHWMPLPDGPK